MAMEWESKEDAQSCSDFDIRMSLIMSWIDSE